MAYGHFRHKSQPEPVWRPSTPPESIAVFENDPVRPSDSISQIGYSRPLPTDYYHDRSHAWHDDRRSRTPQLTEHNLAMYTTSQRSSPRPQPEAQPIIESFDGPREGRRHRQHETARLQPGHRYSRSFDNMLQPSQELQVGGIYYERFDANRSLGSVEPRARSSVRQAVESGPTDRAASASPVARSRTRRSGHVRSPLSPDLAIFDAPPIQQQRPLQSLQYQRGTEQVSTEPVLQSRMSTEIRYHPSSNRMAEKHNIDTIEVEVFDRYDGEHGYRVQRMHHYPIHSTYQ